MIRAEARDRAVRLLIADDNRDFASNLADLARLHGFETEIAHSLGQARRLAADGTYDVAIVDQRMPDGRGLDLLARWRTEQPDLVPIVVTAFASVDSTLAALNHGAFAFVTKDSEPEVLLDALLRAAENAVLRRENRRLRGTQAAILAAMPDQLLIIDASLQVVSANRRDPVLCRPHDPRELPCPLAEFLAPAVFERFDWATLLRDMPATGAREANLTLRLEGDKTRTYGLRATRLTEVAAGTTLLQIIELTERVELVRKLTESEGLATLGRLVAIIAHELRNPITGIRALAQMLEKTLGPDHPERESIDEILALTGRMSATLADILAYSRPRDWREEPIDLRDLIERLAREGRRWPTCEGRSIESSLPSDAEPLVVVGERERLHSAFANLVENALQACPEGGRVRITLGREDHRATVTIADTGSGIPAAQTQRIFDPFFSTKRGGTGLGLPIVKTTVDRHGGTIKVGRSSDLGGAEITVSLPLDPSHRPA